MLGVLHQCCYLLGPYYLWMVHVHMHGFSRETGAVSSTVSLSPDGTATGLYTLHVCTGGSGASGEGVLLIPA